MSGEGKKVTPIMPDGTRGSLTTKSGFQFKRGKDVFMGMAVDEKDNWYEIRSTHCGLPNCYCDAKAIKM